LVDIDPNDFDMILKPRFNFVKIRIERAARPTPFGAEFDKNRTRFRIDLLLEPRVATGNPRGIDFPFSSGSLIEYHYREPDDQEQ
jgi:hypothetical protein